MFNATLDTVAIRLGQTQDAVSTALSELTEISGLTWQTVAGREFTERTTELAEMLQRLREQIGTTHTQLLAATRALAELEEEIIAQLAG